MSFLTVVLVLVSDGVGMAMVPLIIVVATSNKLLNVNLTRHLEILNHSNDKNYSVTWYGLDLA